MKRAIPFIVSALFVSGLVLAYRQMSKERAAEAQGEQAITAESRVERGTNGETIVRLDADTQKLIGLQTAALAGVTLRPEVKGYGHVLDPAPLVGRLSDLASARAALDASGKEYERVKALFAQGQNASAKALETAEAAMKRDQIALQAAEAQFEAAWGQSVARQPDLPAFVQSLARLETALVRLDLPAGESLKELPTGAHLLPPGTGPSVAARFLGPATTTDPQAQGQGFLFLATNTAARLAPGLAVTGLLQLPGEPLHGVIVPDAAVVRSAEQVWAYAQTSDTTFSRREIAPDHPVADGWFVKQGFAPGDRLVVTGAQTLLSEERKTQIQVGD